MLLGKVISMSKTEVKLQQIYMFAKRKAEQATEVVTQPRGTRSIIDDRSIYVEAGRAEAYFDVCKEILGVIDIDEIANKSGE